MTTATSPILSNTSHTPGPWNDDGQFIVAPDPGGIHPDIYIAEIVQEDDEGRIALPEQQQANGSLIAVAPVLLSACLWMMRELCEAWNEDPQTAIPAEYLAAIANATQQ